MKIGNKMLKIQNRKMKIQLKNVIFLLLLLKICIIFGQPPSPKKIFVIDVGHGGKDAGAIGINGIMEKDVVLQLANEILRLNKGQRNLEIYLTRYSDTLISLTDRTRLAKALKADVFISLHCNHSINPGATGTEVYVANTALSQNLRQSIYLAHQVHSGITTNFGIKSRGVKFANFQVLRETVALCPSILIELCFLSNWDEAEYLSENSNLKVLAFSILNSLIKSPEL
jgi:N-acetylmuramoyl-L-alanine amidase